MKDFELNVLNSYIHNGKFILERAKNFALQYNTKDAVKYAEQALLVFKGAKEYAESYLNASQTKVVQDLINKTQTLLNEYSSKLGKTSTTSSDIQK